MCSAVGEHWLQINSIALNVPDDKVEGAAPHDHVTLQFRLYHTPDKDCAIYPTLRTSTSPCHH